MISHRLISYLFSNWKNCIVHNVSQYRMPHFESCAIMLFSLRCCAKFNKSLKYNEDALHHAKYHRSPNFCNGMTRPRDNCNCLFWNLWEMGHILKDMSGMSERVDETNLMSTNVQDFLLTQISIKKLLFVWRGPFHIK